MSNKTINGINVSEWELKGVLIPITECKYFEGIGDCKETRGLCVDNNNCYFKQCKRLEQENKELKKRQITKNGFICDCEQNAKYKQALEEINKWATNHNPCDIEAGFNCTKEDCFECLNYDIKKITRIIDEVLND